MSQNRFSSPCRRSAWRTERTTRSERRLVVGVVPLRVAAGARDRADLGELRLEEPLQQRLQPRVHVHQEDAAILVPLEGREVGQRRAEEVLDLREAAGHEADGRGVFEDRARRACFVSPG